MEETKTEADPAKDVIDGFFADRIMVTQGQCDEHAVLLLGGTASPVALQGSSTYTVVAGLLGRKIVQFRPVDDDFDRSLLDKARRTHRELVPRYIFEGCFNGLFVYIMDLCPGEPLCVARAQYRMSPLPSLRDDSQYLVTVKDLAIIFAATWAREVKVAPGAAQALMQYYQSKLQRMASNLPCRFRSHLREIIAGLNLLFREGYPMTLSHGDPSGRNIYVDPATGSVTGIIGWSDACIAPFGINLWGIDHALRYQANGVWRHVYWDTALRTRFWQAFVDVAGELTRDQRRGIQIARMAGIFLKYGDAGGDPGSVDSGADFSIDALDAFCPREEWEKIP